MTNKTCEHEDSIGGAVSEDRVNSASPLFTNSGRIRGDWYALVTRWHFAYKNCVGKPESYPSGGVPR